jgi:pimeloyl-ACP methyl ester carboxylesterase
MIMGFVCCTRYWDAGSGPLGIGHQSAPESLKLKPLHICCFDNRGCGKSSRPIGAYTTNDMARDAIMLLEHLGWIRWASHPHLVAVVATNNYVQTVVVMINGQDLVVPEHQDCTLVCFS